MSAKVELAVGQAWRLVFVDGRAHPKEPFIITSMTADVVKFDSGTGDPRSHLENPAWHTGSGDPDDLCWRQSTAFRIGQVREGVIAGATYGSKVKFRVDTIDGELSSEGNDGSDVTCLDDGRRWTVSHAWASILVRDADDPKNKPCNCKVCSVAYASPDSPAAPAQETKGQDQMAKLQAGDKCLVPMGWSASGGVVVSKDDQRIATIVRVESGDIVSLQHDNGWKSRGPLELLSAIPPPDTEKAAGFIDDIGRKIRIGTPGIVPADWEYNDLKTVDPGDRDIVLTAVVGGRLAVEHVISGKKAGCSIGYANKHKIFSPDAGDDSDADNETTGEESDMSDQPQAKEAKQDFKDITIGYSKDVKQVILPEGMTPEKGIEWLRRIAEENKREIKLYHEIDAYPIEGSAALLRAIKERYGFVSLEATPTFFGEDPPRMVGLDVSLTERIQVPWGRIKLPTVNGYLETSGKVKPDGSVKFVLAGVIQRKHENEINDLVKLVREFVGAKSIYRGKAIRVKFPDDSDDWDFTYTPTFIDTRKVNPSELIFPDDIARRVNVSLFAPIERTEVARALGIPLKRGVLLEGPYGVGKTLTAYVAAKKCEENGWTFIYLDKTSHLRQAITLARQYQPAVIFAEDLDRITDGDRDEEMDRVLNLIDGIDGKSSEIIVVLTTNDVDKINRAMLRPGRLDDVIPVRAPDAVAAMRLVKTYGRGLIRQDEDLADVGVVLAGMKPAVIREVVERAKLGAIVHLPADATSIELTAQDLIVSAESMRTQLEIMERPEPEELSDIEKAAGILGDKVQQTITALASQAPSVGAESTNGGRKKQLPAG